MQWSILLITRCRRCKVITWDHMILLHFFRRLVWIGDEFWCSTSSLTLLVYLDVSFLGKKKYMRFMDVLSLKCIKPVKWNYVANNLCYYLRRAILKCIGPLKTVRCTILQIPDPLTCAEKEVTHLGFEPMTSGTSVVGLTNYTKRSNLPTMGKYSLWSCWKSNPWLKETNYTNTYLFHPNCRATL